MLPEVLVGTLLGDASIPMFQGKSRLRVQFAQKMAEYIWHLYDLFQKPDFVGTPPRNLRGGGPAGARDRQHMRVHTYAHPELIIVGMKFSIQLIHKKKKSS